jgi:hypothetical protein
MTDQLTAGPELDARIATEVMGWRFDERWGQIVPPEQQAGPDEMWRRSKFGFEPVPGNTVLNIAYNGNLTAIHVPKYSTDIADAWRVLESFEPDCVWAIGVHPNGYYAVISVQRAEFGPMQIAATVPLAICRAALFWHAEQRAIYETYGAPNEVREVSLAAVRAEFLTDQPTEVVRA